MTVFPSEQKKRHLLQSKILPDKKKYLCKPPVMKKIPTPRIYGYFFHGISFLLRCCDFWYILPSKSVLLETIFNFICACEVEVLDSWITFSNYLILIFTKIRYIRTRYITTLFWDPFGYFFRKTTCVNDKVTTDSPGIPINFSKYSKYSRTQNQIEIPHQI